MSSRLSPLLVFALGTIGFAMAIFLMSAGIVRADRTAVSATGGLTTSGTCNTASSTLFAIQPPPAATSTAALVTIWGQGTTTSMDIVVGTSTSAFITTPFATSTLNENIMGVSAIPANAQFYSVAGQTIGPGTGYNSASGGAYITRTFTVVGPNEFIKGLSTSTNPTGGGAIPASCNYKILWFQ